MNSDNSSIHNRNIPQPIREQDGAGGTDPGPRDVMRDIENPDMLVPPVTDHGGVPNAKFSFSDTHMRLQPGGWARQVTTKELPISVSLAGVNMRLNPGGVREMHWHTANEWAFMLTGRARITAVDQDGRNFVDDVGPGDLWFFPAGIPHSIQGLVDGCEFLLIFDQGDFSENNTFSVSDWFAHTPIEVLSANFGVPERAFSNIAPEEKYIFPADVPGALESDIVTSPAGVVPHIFSHQMVRQQPIQSLGGRVWIADANKFPATTISAALVEVEPGGMREMHWHPNADEWQYYIQGTARMTLFAAQGTANTFNYRAGDVGYVPMVWGHYIQNTGDKKLIFLEIFKSPQYADVSLNQWMALTPPELVEANLNVGSDVISRLSKTKNPVVKYPTS
ncbi:oxalate decarboxylase family bicupin [Alicyclobacillus fastidiosus]|uniref:Oxalate decarboxylase family bicupin n=1 Tax=Alicyclobacillus fastidiosus TaxID=392011 RepID=A0ABY6ZCQ0_9BACL|nr:oxalate decarboxylase family bicupin [Alicyclobacillus fastidiosus]WAH40558.1 oxalate decarboxylase family bicupin [Alicyclobacillus fastidiosus]GMA61992.1 oxalate decarboxylase [Alicyclobacillus fastidiosus]